MKRTVFTLVFSALLCGGLVAQKSPKFRVELSSDSILMGNSFRAMFILENAKGENFEPPSFSEFFIVNGPAFSSSFSIVNGDVSQSVSYTYLLEPKEVGNYFIQPASISVGGNILETLPVAIMVVPNPDGIKTDPEGEEIEFLDGGFDNFRNLKIPPPPAQEAPKTEPKPKKKTYKL
jgi:hypothetical protein